MLLSLSHISKSYGPTVVLSNVSFVVNQGDRMALVGPNGVGKSTLLRVLAGAEQPDGGTVDVPRPLDVGYLPQMPSYAAGQTVDDLVREAHGRIGTVQVRLREVEDALSRAIGVSQSSLLEEHAALSEQFERLGGYDLDRRLDAVFAGLGVAHVTRDRKVAGLSGGEKARAGLACLLLRSPDLLLLDEPTNHLDAEALAWLEEYLRKQRAAFIVVSHDRAFVNRTATAIVEIDEHLRDARVFPGSYDAYLAARERELARWREAYEREHEEIRDLRAAIKGSARRVGHTNRPPPDNDKFAKTFFGENVQRAVARNVRAAEHKLREILETPLLKPPEPLRLHVGFHEEAPTGHAPLIATGIWKRYGARTVLEDVSLTLGARSRVVLTGPNGAGKSTLLRLLAGREHPDAGSITHAPTVRPGYLDQEGEDVDPSRTVFDVYCAGLEGHADALQADLFRHGLFRHPDEAKRVADLSVGQRRKLQLARLIAQRPNLLLLDEPTNHIDFPTLEALEEALAAFPGPAFAVSHDRRFVQRFGGEVWELRAGRLFTR